MESGEQFSGTLTEIFACCWSCLGLSRQLAAWWILYNLQSQGLTGHQMSSMHTEFTLYPQQFKDSLESKYSPLHLPSGPLQLSEQEKAFFNFLSVIEAPGSLEASVDTFSLYLYGVGGFFYYKLMAVLLTWNYSLNSEYLARRSLQKTMCIWGRAWTTWLCRRIRLVPPWILKHPPTPDLKLSSACTQNKTTQNLKSSLRQLPHFQQIMKFEFN